MKRSLFAFGARAVVAAIAQATKRLGLVAIANCILVSTAHGQQVMGEMWARLDGAPDVGTGASAVAVDAAGSVFVGGITSNYGGTQNAAWIRKFAAADGALLWEQRLEDKSGDARVVALQVDSNGDLIATATTRATGTIQLAIYTVKYRGLDGQKIWEQTDRGPFNYHAEAVAMVLDPNGSAIVIADIAQVEGGSDYYTVKYAGNTGARVWAKTYNGPANYSDRPYFVGVDQHGNVIVSGTSHSVAPGAAGNTRSKVYTVKYAAADGGVLWEQRLNVADTPDQILGFAVDHSGDAVLTGSVGNINTMVKLAGADGHVVWSRLFPSTSENFILLLALDTDSVGDVFATGQRTRRPNEQEQYQTSYTVKVSGATGNQLWEQENIPRNKLGSDHADWIGVDGSGNPVVLGYSYSETGNNSYTASYNGADGALLWEQITAFSDGDLPNAMAVAPDNTVAVVGSTSATGISDYQQAFTVKYGMITPGPTPEPTEPRLWVAGRDLAKYERKAAAAGANTVVPQWSYGYRWNVNGTDFTPFSPSEHTNAERDRPAVQGWTSTTGTVVVANTGATPEQYFAGSESYLLLPDQMLIKRNLSTGAMPVVRWTAPADGSYRVIAKWHDLDPATGGGAAHVLVNGTQVFGRQQNNAFIGQEWGNRGNAMMPTHTFYLRVGDVVDFVLGTRGLDSSTRDTGFAAAIAPVPTVTISSPAAEYVEGQDLTVTVAVQHKYAITGVKLLNNGQPAPVPEDTTAPYEFTLKNVDPRTYNFTAVVRDEFDAEAASAGMIVVVTKGGPFAAARTKQSTGGSLPSQAAAGGITYRCTQSGSWHDPATWGGLGVPGRNDDAIIAEGFEVSYFDPTGENRMLEIDNIHLGGGLVSDVGLLVHGTMQANGYFRGTGSGEGTFVLTINKGATFVNVSGQAFFENVNFVNRGTTILGQNGGINGSESTLFNEGIFKMLPAPGSNRPTVARMRGVEMKGGLITLGPYTHLITTGSGIVAAGAGNIVAAGAGNIVAAGAGNIVAAGAGNLIGSDGASLIGSDGATLIGSDGASIVAAGAGNIVAAGAGNLIGSDGGSMVAAGAGNFVGQPDMNKTAGHGERSQESFDNATDAGTISLEGGTVSGNLSLLGDVSNTGAHISPGNSAGKIRIIGNYTQGAGGTLLLEIGGTATSPVLQYDQLQITGTANLGGNLIVKTINGFTPQSGDSFAPLTYSSVSGNFASITSNAQISLGPNGMTMQVSGANPPAPKALNIATRMKVETGDNVLIAGFIITGSQSKKVIIRGIGPSLPFGGVLANPTLNLDNGTVTNDNWRTNQEQEIIATTIPPSNNLESAIVATLAPGPHTAILAGAGGATGIGVVEVYDLDSGSPVQLANISSRGFVQSGDNVMIGGFIIGGDYPAKVIIRAIGPSLPIPGVLQNPTLELVDSNGSRISNDNWRTTQEAEIIATTVPPAHDQEAAIVATLVPGAYTAIVRGKDDTTGIAVVEAYNLQ